jgi:hypothetical protein
MRSGAQGGKSRLRFRHAIILSALLVAACGHNEWFRIAPGPGNFPQDDYACQRESLQAAPVAVVQEYERTKNERSVTARDVNQGNRNNLYFACMGARGWQERFVPDKQSPPAAVAAAPAFAAPPPAAAFDPSGVWHIEEGDLALTLRPNGILQGRYPDGSISGRLIGTVFEGTWREAKSERTCRETHDGRYWGRVVLRFAPDQRHFTGQWSYCDDAPGDSWDGYR